MKNQVIFIAYAVIFFISIVQLAAGGFIINVGKQLSDTRSSIYQTFYTDEGGYYLAVGILSIILSVVLVVLTTVMTNSDFSKLTLGLFLLLLLCCLQSALAVHSAINATVLSSENDQFSTFSQSQCDLVTLRNMVIAVALISWIFACPIGGGLLNWHWKEWRKGLEKDIDEPQLEGPTQQVDNSVRRPLY